MPRIEPKRGVCRAARGGRIEQLEKQLSRNLQGADLFAGACARRALVCSGSSIGRIHRMLFRLWKRKSDWQAGVVELHPSQLVKPLEELFNGLNALFFIRIGHVANKSINSICD